MNSSAFSTIIFDNDDHILIDLQDLQRSGGEISIGKGFPKTLSM